MLSFVQKRLLTKAHFEIHQSSTMTSSSTILIDKNERKARTNDEWMNAKSYNEIPGPSKYLFPFEFLPGGNLYNKTLLDLHKYLRKNYGDICLLRGSLGQQDIVLTFNPNDYETVYRTEGIWPERKGLATFDYYRKNVRPDVFKGIGGLVTEQGQIWANIRSKVNPVLMKPKTVRHHLSQIDEIAIEFANKIPKIRNPTTMEMPANFGDEVKHWSFESISSIGLNRRLDLIQSNKLNERVQKLAAAMQAFFQLSYEFEMLPPFWKIYKTKKFYELMSLFDTITEITISYIDEAIQEFRSDDDANGILQKLIKIDRNIAFVMVMDMLMAGIDTTSSAFFSVLYLLAKNPEKQEKLHAELLKILPQRDTKLTIENTKNMPYLRACIKESLRIIAITPGNLRSSGQDIVLSGYQVPKGTGVLMSVMTLSNEEKYFKNAKEFLPERWLSAANNGCPESKSSNPFVYLPFGFGSRTCIGKRIAEMEIETVLARLIRNYKISWHHAPMQYKSNLIIMPTGDLKFKFEDI